MTMSAIYKEHAWIMANFTMMITESLQCAHDHTLLHFVKGVAYACKTND